MNRVLVCIPKISFVYVWTFTCKFTVVRSYEYSRILIKHFKICFNNIIKIIDCVIKIFSDHSIFRVRLCSSRQREVQCSIEVYTRDGHSVAREPQMALWLKIFLYYTLCIEIFLAPIENGRRINKQTQS